MKFKNNKYAKLIIEKFADMEIENVTIEQYLNSCAGSINECGNQEITAEEFDEVLKEILGKELWNSYFNDRDFDALFTYSENLHDFVLQTIKIELIKFNALNNKFSDYYTSKLSNKYLEYYNYNGYKKLNNDGANMAYAILRDIAEFKNVIDFDN